MSKAPQVSLIVTTFQMPSHLERVLESVRQQTVAGAMELIIADDGSTDGTAALVERFARSAPFDVRFVTQRHQGFRLARCRNLGAAAATAPHLVFLDGDCLIPPDHVEQHLREHCPGRVTNTYCVRLSETTSQQITAERVRDQSYLKLAPRSDIRGLAVIQWKARFYTLLGHRKKPALRGGNVGISRADYLRVNGYDENFQGWGCEDDDLGDRLRAADLKIHYILHRTRTYHLWHPPAVTRPNRMREGQNFGYLTRRIRLTRCLRGVVDRLPRDLQLGIVDGNRHEAEARRFLAARGLPTTALSSPPSNTERLDAELLFLPSAGRFSNQADCRIAVVNNASTLLPANARQAQIVLSPRGDVGDNGQIRLRLDDPAALWQELGWQAPAAAAAA